MLLGSSYWSLYWFDQYHRTTVIIITVLTRMVCVGMPSLKSGSRWRDGFDLARKLCFEDLLKSIIITIIQVTNVILVIASITISFSLHILSVLSLNLLSVFSTAGALVVITV